MSTRSVLVVGRPCFISRRSWETEIELIPAAVLMGISPPSAGVLFLLATDSQPFLPETLEFFADRAV